MSQKLLLAAAISFLSIALGVALCSANSLAVGRRDFYGTAVTWFVFTFPLAFGIVIWEHRTSVILKYLSAGTGLIATVILIWHIEPVSHRSTDFKTTVAVVDRLILIFSCFILSTTLTSVVGRISISLWNLFRYLTLKLKYLSRALPN